ncbi:MAG TPA: S8 family serine peptidase [Verrucomicrobiae bacterium]|nr:S8 family serine peptidase [Verrucomicrobiae bacterium]
MILRQLKVKKSLAVVLLPIFLLNLSFFAASSSASEAWASIIFKTSTDPVIIGADYKLVDLSQVYPLSKSSELQKVYKATVTLDSFSKLKTDPRIEYAEFDRKISASAVTPNDQYFTTDPFFEDGQWYLPRMKMPDAWELSKGSSGIVVAIIDTGIHATHVELRDGRVIGGYDTINDLIIPANTNSDDNGHGTAVAGVIGAITNNNRGIAGINWDVKLMPLKALEAGGTGAISTVSEAIVWAVDHGAHILNLSIGGPGFGADKTLNDAITYAFDHDAVIVAAAGNDQAEHGINLDNNPVYPICSDGGRNMVIGVAASDPGDRKADFSNFGINCVDITAPGKKILTTAYLPSDPSDSVLIYASGTSLATPMVSGVAALLKGKNFDLTNTQIRDILLGTTDNIDHLNPNNCLGTSCAGFLGKGRINAAAALSPQPLLSGTFVRESLTGKIYQIERGTKRYVSNFVFNQRGYNFNSIVNEYNGQLSNMPTAEPLPPFEGTLIKGMSDPTVYLIHQQQKRPLTFLVFNSRGYKFSDVSNLPDADVAAIKTGDWYWPPNGTMVLVKGDPTVYVMDKEVRRPVTFFVFKQRKLSFARVVTVSLDELTHIPKAPDAYWLPPVEGTLVKSATNPAVYLIQNESRRPISGQAFINRGFRFANIITLPQAEIDVILPGSPIFN